MHRGQALAHRPEVIISDVNLGSGGSGSDAVRRIVAALGDIPVLFVTGEPQAFQPDSPAMRVLHTPVDDRTLVATFRSIAPLA